MHGYADEWDGRAYSRNEEHKTSSSRAFGEITGTPPVYVHEGRGTTPLYPSHEFEEEDMAAHTPMRGA